MLVFLFPITAFAHSMSQQGSSPLNVTIQKKTVHGELMVKAVDDGEARYPLKLIVRVKCAKDDKWVDVDPGHVEIPERVCYMFGEKAGDWQEGTHTLTIHYVMRKDVNPKSSPCADGRMTEIDLREVCAPN